MERHLLITISEDQRALYGVRFVGNFFKDKKGLKLTLFYTTPRPPMLGEEEHSHESVALRMEQARMYESKGRKAISAAGKELRSLGFTDAQVEGKLLPRRYSKVMDIIQEAEKGLYDAVVLGRRGLSWLEEVFEESVTQGLLGRRIAFPLWICRRVDPQRRNILVCLDGSDAAYRMADHAAFILRDEQEQNVTLLTVRRKDDLQSANSESIMERAKEHLTANGFPLERVSTQVLEGVAVAKAIAREAQAGGYAAVAVGRTGTGEGVLKRLFMGSVSSALARGLEGAALWVTR